MIMDGEFSNFASPTEGYVNISAQLLDSSLSILGELEIISNRSTISLKINIQNGNIDIHEHSRPVFEFGSLSGF